MERAKTFCKSFMYCMVIKKRHRDFRPNDFFYVTIQYVPARMFVRKHYVETTTNEVESYHRMVIKFTKSKAVFPTDDSIRKAIFMSVKEISKKWTMPVRDWGLAYSKFAILFEDRLTA